MKNWSGRILSDSKAVDLSLLVAYDLDYNNTRQSDYTNIDIELREMLSDIHFIDRASIQSESHFLADRGIITAAQAALFFEKGYAGKRNAILYTAAKQGIDALLFLDDDEYPLAVQKNDGIESWTGQQILSTHLKYIDGAHITNGHHCGYISPIPNILFNDVLTEDDFRVFVEAISNDVINWTSIKSLMENGSITYADSSVIASAAAVVPQEGRAKFITGSNLCLNLRKLTEVSPFYNPPSARGEDTFLSTCLADKTVLRVPCYTFHDGFSVYTSMLRGVLPQKLKHITASSKHVAERFYRTCTGWARYKPLLLYITRPGEFAEQIAQTRRNLERTLPKLSEFFNNPKFMKIAAEFDKYAANVEPHFAAFEETRAIWQKLAAYLTARN
jgi:hypothetical protein